MFAPALRNAYIIRSHNDFHLTAWLCLRGGTIVASAAAQQRAGLARSLLHCVPRVIIIIIIKLATNGITVALNDGPEC
jgi:hypothetical protein